MNMPSPSHITIPIFGSLGISPVAGALERILLNIGAGLRDSRLSNIVFTYSPLLLSGRHRVLAELLEQGTQSNLVIPIHNPIVGTVRVVGLGLGAEAESSRSLGLNPSHALQHPGFYYYMAAKCTEMRRERFLANLELEVSDIGLALSLILIASMHSGNLSSLSCCLLGLRTRRR